jgi:hypothetical protein
MDQELHSALTLDSSFATKVFRLSCHVSDNFSVESARFPIDS